MYKQYTQQQTVYFVKNFLLPFIGAFGDRRISRKTVEYYRNYLFAEHKDELVIAESTDSSGNIHAISVAAIINGAAKYSITITEPNSRRFGYGTQALLDKKEALKSKGLGLRTFVAEDNFPSMKLCRKAGLIPFESLKRKRSTGEYNCILWVDPPKLPED